jgi:hypothetical protein
LIFAIVKCGVLFEVRTEFLIQRGSGGKVLRQGFSKCGTRTNSGTPETVQWYTSIVRKTNQRMKNIKVSSINAVT